MRRALHSRFHQAHGEKDACSWEHALLEHHVRTLRACMLCIQGSSRSKHVHTSSPCSPATRYTHMHQRSNTFSIEALLTSKLHVEG